MNNSERKTIGLALGGGGVRGMAHIGVMKTLLKHEIPIDFIAGSSIGAWMAAFYAVHEDIDLLEEVSLNYKRQKFFSLIEPGLKAGIIRGKRVYRFLHKWLGDYTIEELPIPIATTATDIIHGEELDIMTGSVTEAVHASIAIPGLFQPVKRGNCVLVDGAIVNPVPDNVVRAMGADIVISVSLDIFNIEDDKPTTEKISLAQVIRRSFSIMRYHMAEYSTNSSDFLIEPNIPNYGFGNWKDYFTKEKGKEFLEAGVTATEKIIPQLKEKML